MGMQKYSTVLSRNLIRAEGKMLKHAEARIVLGSFGDQKEQPLNKTDTIVFRRLKPFNAGSNEVAQITAANFATSEGTTPNANEIGYTDVTTTLSQYAVLFKFSSKASLMYEDDIPGDMKKLTGETLAMVGEKISYGQLRAGSGVVYANGSTRAGINTTISINGLRRAARTLETNHGDKVTSRIKPGPDFGTSSVDECYVVFTHTDSMADVSDLPKFKDRADYGSAFKPVHEREYGACEQFRFVSSPMFSPFLAAGSDTLNSMYASDSTNVDVYPAVIIAQNALAHVSLKGHGQTAISPTLIPASVKNHANPMGMFGYVGADFWYSCVRLNENMMIRYEHAVSDLS